MLWVIFLAMAVGGGLFSIFEMIRTSFFGQTTGNWVLQINKQVINAPEFMRSVAEQEERIRMIRSQYGQYADLYFQMMGMRLDPQDLAAKALIRKALLNQVAAQMPLAVSPEMAQSQLNNPMFISQEISDLVPFFTWDHSLGGVNPVMLHSYLQQIGVSTDEFNHELSLAIQRNDIRNLVEHGAYIPEFEPKSNLLKIIWVINFQF